MVGTNNLMNMKTIYKGISFLAIALAAFGCAKDIKNIDDSQLNKISFTGVTDASTRSALTSDYYVTWSSGDKISVFANGENKSFVASNLRDDNKTATFEGMAAAADTYYAIYPYNESATISGTVITTELPVDQTAVDGSFAEGANLSTAASASDDILTFRNAGAIVGLTVNGDGISGIRLSSADDTKLMAGTVTIDVSSSSPSMTVADGGSKYVRLVPADSTLESGKKYYFVVVPGEYNGLKLVFENSSKDATCTKTTTGTVTINRNGNKNLGTFTISDSDWTANTYQDYVLNGKSEVDSLIATIGDEKIQVRNLTITGHDVNDAVLSSLAAKISAVLGTLTFDGIGSENTTDWLNTNQFISSVDCQGSIIFQNISNIVNPNGFSAYTTIGGDFIIDNCPNYAIADWVTSLSSISEVKGDFIIRGVNRLAGSVFNSLAKVGGDFELSGMTNVWSLKNGMQVRQIGGDLVLKDNSSLWSLHGFEKLIDVGGNVVITNNNPKLPISSGNVDGDDCIGLCLIKDLKDMGVFSSDAVFNLATGSENTSVSVDSLPSCTPDRTSKSYVIMGEEELKAFINGRGEEKETVYDLYITGSDITEGTLRDLELRVGKIEGTLTFSEIGTSDTWLSTDQCLEFIDMQGSIEFHDVPAHVNPNGMGSWTKIPGNVVIDNCPQFPNDWDPFTSCTEVGGDIRIIGPIKGFNSRFFPALSKIGGDFYVDGVSSFWDFSDDNGDDLTDIGGDLTIINCPDFTRDSKGFKGFQNLTRIGGSVLINVPVWIPENDYSSSKVGACLFNYLIEQGVVARENVKIIGAGGELDLEGGTIGSCGGDFPS